MDFSNNSGLGLGVGTTQTLFQTGIEMQVLSGSYEITWANELNLKDFAGNGTTRTVQFEEADGSKFNFLGFHVGDGFGTATLTSNLGGSFPFTFFAGNLTFSGPKWDGLSWIQITTSSTDGEMKMTPFNFEQPTVPEPSTAIVAVFGAVAFIAYGWSRRRRGNRGCWPWSWWPSFKVTTVGSGGLI
jgi:hypothetical protein